MSHAGLGERVPPHGPGDQGFLGANPRSQILTRWETGSGKTQGSVQLGEERGGDASFPHPQHKVPRRHSPGWSRLCSARICCAGQRQKALAQSRMTPQRPGIPQPAQLSAAAAAQGSRGQHCPRALPDPTQAPRRERQCQDGDTGAPRAEGCLHPWVSAARSRHALGFPVHPQPRSRAACSTRTPGRAEQA